MNQGRTKDSADGTREPVQISRDYNFPRETIFGMFADPKKAAKFFSPEGAVKLLFEWDARPGGAIRIHDRHDGVTYKTSGTFLEFVVPELLVYRSATTPGDEAAPFEAVQSMKFEALGPRRTRVTVQVKVLAPGSFEGGVESLEEGFLGGWGQTLDILQRELR